MPRRPYYRRKNRSKKAWYNKKYSVKQLAYKAYKGVRYIRGLVNSEMFSNEITAVSQAIDTTGTVTHLSAIAQDNTESGRTGNSILAKSIYVRIQVSAVSTVNTFLRVALVMDTQQVGDTSPSITDIFQGSSSLTPVNDATKGRFTLLYNKVHSFDSAKGISKQINILRKMSKHIRYNGTASSDVQKNGIYLILVSDQISTNRPTISYYSRLSYHDN